MTAEIAILNKSAVALAADSAVTISTPTGPKIYDSVNKLFALVKRQPVGVMVYDSADFLGVPWETIIKAYRMSRAGNGFTHLENYGEDLIDYIQNHEALVPADLRLKYLDELIERRFDCVRMQIDNLVRDDLKIRKAVGQQRLRQLIGTALDSEELLWSGQPDGPWASRIDATAITKSKQSYINTTIDEVFGTLPLTAAHKRRLSSLVRDSVGRQIKRHPTLRGAADPLSGIVVAGFGSDEYFPSILAFDITGIIDGNIRAVRSVTGKITVENSAMIVPFAQSEMVHAFVSGLNPRYEQEMRGHWRALHGEYPQAVVNLLTKMNPGIDTAAMSAITGQLATLVATSTRDLEQRLNELKNEQVAPVLDSVKFLPKDELAAMAESLVNLTSLKRRVSIGEAQTVGGPVDVALISRGDGLVWIKRKHYFDPHLNPSWASVHADH